MGTSRISPGHLAIPTSRISPVAKPSLPHSHVRFISPVAANVILGQRRGVCHREGTRCFARQPPRTRRQQVASVTGLAQGLPTDPTRLRFRGAQDSSQVRS